MFCFRELVICNALKGPVLSLATAVIISSAIRLALKAIFVWTTTIEVKDYIRLLISQPTCLALVEEVVASHCLAVVPPSGA
jgi:hypothetical protein